MRSRGPVPGSVRSDGCPLGVTGRLSARPHMTQGGTSFWLPPFVLILFLLLLFFVPAAHADTSRRPRLFLIVCDGLILDDIHLGDNTNPHLANLAEHGTVGLMNARSGAHRRIPRPCSQLPLASRRSRSRPTNRPPTIGKRFHARSCPRRRVTGCDGPASAAPPEAFDPNHSVKHLGMRETPRARIRHGAPRRRSCRGSSSRDYLARRECRCEPLAAARRALDRRSDGRRGRAWWRCGITMCIGPMASWTIPSLWSSTPCKST